MYIYVRMYIYISVYVYLCKNVYIHLYLCIYICKNEYLCKNVYLYLCIVQAGLEMLESEFSLELEELMEQHLEQQNSFPMFLAGLTMQAYRKRQVRR